LAAGVADLDGKVVGDVRARPIRGLEVEPAEVLEAVAAALDRAGVERERLLGIGCAARGVLDPATGTVLWGSTLPWRNVPLREMLESRFGVPTWVEDYSRVMALAEHALAGKRGARDLIYVHVGRGVSAGIVIGGQIYPHAGGHAGEFGHTVVAMGGEPCACGRQGCLETLASWSAVRQRVAAALTTGAESRLRASWERGGDLRPEELATAAEAGDAVAASAIRAAVTCAARGIVNLVNLLNPERVVVGGSLVEACPGAIALIKAIVAAESMPNAAARVELVAPALSQNAGLRAAAMLALREWSLSNGWLRGKA
jgi:glucokinase